MCEFAGAIAEVLMGRSFVSTQGQSSPQRKIDIGFKWVTDRDHMTQRVTSACSSQFLSLDLVPIFALIWCPKGTSARGRAGPGPSREMKNSP